MKKLVLSILLIISSLSITYFAGGYIINEVDNYYYRQGVYDTPLNKLLYLFKLTEKYIPYYNNGNIFYQTEDYGNAIKNYQKALENNPPEERVCQVRVNYALAFIKTIDFNFPDEAIQKLDEAKQILYGDDCAGVDEQNGEDPTSDHLEEEINNAQKELDKSMNTPEEDPEGGEGEQEEQEQTPEEKEQEEKDNELEEKLKEQEQQAHGSREEAQRNENENYSNVDRPW